MRKIKYTFQIALSCSIVAPFFYSLFLMFFFPPFTLTQIGVWADSIQFQSGGADFSFDRDYISWDATNYTMKVAVMASEDQTFLDHHGFDFESMWSAWERSKRKVKKIKGASTISQQVAKNVFLWQSRTYTRKFLELGFTALIETMWSKKRILEIYLNVIEMGRGVIGVEAAAQRHFRKPAKALSLYEAASIAALLPNPKKYNIQKNYIQVRKYWISAQAQDLLNDSRTRRFVKQKNYANTD